VVCWLRCLGQWARRYLRAHPVTRSSPHKRARIRAFFAEGVDKLHLPWAVEALRFLLPSFPFPFLCRPSCTALQYRPYAVFGPVAGWVGLCVAVYGYITLIPIFRQDSPYCSPVSSPAWSLLNGTILCGHPDSRLRPGFLTASALQSRDRMLDLGVAS
jgi:hypothetical protein